MKVFYDGFIYAEQWRQKGGISRYFDNLINNLPMECFPVVTTTRPRNSETLDHKNLELYRFPLNFKPRRFSRVIQKQYFQYKSQKIQAQIFHPTYYQLLDNYFARRTQSPTVITVYDMIHEIFSHSMDPRNKIAKIKKNAIFSAQAIICISESTKRDLLEIYPSLEERIFVTYLATELNKDYVRETETSPEFPYFIYVGSRSYYKNFDRLLMAFSVLVNKYPDVKLCIVGSPFKQQEARRIAEFNLSEKIVNYGLVNDHQLAKLYNSSLALVYPSMYEGFGIPPLEAMSCGTIVIASNASSIPEVVGEVGLYFDPASVDELLDQLLIAIENPIQCQKLKNAALQQVKKFSWKKTAQQTINIYKKLV